MKLDGLERRHRMHGIIFAELQRFAEKNLGSGSWGAVLRSAGLDGHVYMSVRDYPDSELFAIISAASEAANKPANEIVEAFGVFIAPDLLRMYGVLIKPEWRTLDVLERTETVIHAVVRTNQTGARPPELKCRRVRTNEVEIGYNSPRKLCYLAKGIIGGIAEHYHEKITMNESACMHRGSPACVIHVRT